MRGRADVTIGELRLRNSIRGRLVNGGVDRDFAIAVRSRWQHPGRAIDRVPRFGAREMFSTVRVRSGRATDAAVKRRGIGAMRGDRRCSLVEQLQGIAKLLNLFLAFQKLPVQRGGFVRPSALERGQVVLKRVLRARAGSGRPSGAEPRPRALGWEQLSFVSSAASSRWGEKVRGSVAVALRTMGAYSIRAVSCSNRSRNDRGTLDARSWPRDFLLQW